MKNNLFSIIVVTGILTLSFGAGVVQSINIYSEYDKNYFELNPWWNDEWMYRKQITIHHEMVDGNLLNFPVLINEISSDFGAHAQPDGDDFVFVSADNSVKYYHEIEHYNGATGKLISWVNVPNIDSDEDTKLYVYYRNPASSNQQNPPMVWDSYYVGVWHMNEESGNIQDSTGTQDGNVIGSPSYQQIGEKIYKSIYFDGSNFEYFDITNDIYKFYDEEVTLETWVYYSENRDYYETPVDFGDTDHYPSMRLQKIRSGYEPLPGHLLAKENYVPDGTGFNEAYSNTGGMSHIGHWIYQVGRFERGVETSLYVNGVKQDLTDSCENNNLAGGSNFNARIGTAAKTSGYNPDSMKGYIDEVRISKDIARSGAWISTSYNNQNNPQGFLSFGPQEMVSLAPSAPVINGPTSGEIKTSHTYTFVTEDPNEDNVYYQIDWGDGNIEDWFGPYESNEIISKSHKWSIEGEFIIKARAKDINEEIGEWGTLDVTMPKNKPFVFNFPLLNWLFDRFPSSFPPFRLILRFL